jgi:hypothetical protein
LRSCMFITTMRQQAWLDPAWADRWETTQRSRMSHLHCATGVAAPLATPEQMSHLKCGRRYSDLSIVQEGGKAVPHARAIAPLFDDEQAKLLENAAGELGAPERFGRARRLSEDLLLSGQFDPI